MACIFGLEVNKPVTLEELVTPDNCLRLYKRVNFHDASKRVPDSGKYVFVCPENDHNPNIPNPFKSNLVPREPYTCLGYHETSIINNIRAGNIPEGTCAQCPYNELSQPDLTAEELEAPISVQP